MSMRLAGPTTRTLPFVRTGVDRNAALLIFGVAGAVSLLQRIRGKKRKSALHRYPRSHPPQYQTVQALQTADTLKDWSSDTAPIALANVEDGQVLLLDEVLQIGPKQLWKLIYDLSFIQQFYQKKGNRDIGIGSWQRTGQNEYTKTAHYITPVKKNVLGPSEAYTEEDYSCCKRGEGGFIVKVCAYNRKVPYGGSFHVELFWTATRLSASKTRLQVVGVFVVEKRMLGVAGLIRKATHEGLHETYSLFRQHLLDSLESRSLKQQGLAARPDVEASRSASAITKEAAEDLVRNGIFISWGQLIWGLLLACCIAAMTKLVLSKEAQEKVLNNLRMEWQSSFARV